MYHIGSPLIEDIVRVTGKVVGGPGMDPNKVGHLMDQFAAPTDWPRWCRLTRHMQNLIRESFLSALPDEMARQHGKAIEEHLDSIRLRRLTHYKCTSDGNDELIRADFDYTTKATTTKLIATWQRDLWLEDPVVGRERPRLIKSGLPCTTVDLMTYITEADFKVVVNVKGAYPLRYAEFPSPGPDILQVGSVLDTHTVEYPTTASYSALCYWYAGSTFEILADIGHAKVVTDPLAYQRKWPSIFRRTAAVAYGSVTERALTAASTAVGDDVYEQHLVTIQKQLFQKFTRGKTGITDEELAALPEDDRQSMAEHGWNVAQYLRIVRAMPTHETLLQKSTSRNDAVRAQLKDIQDERQREAKAAREKANKELMARVDQLWAAKVAEHEAKIASFMGRADEHAGDEM